MKSIKNNISNKIVINKSEFICEIIKIKDVNKISEEIEKIKIKYKDATHYCYAYIIGDKRKSSDDGEPGGTAGVPMMETLSKYDLNYVLCVVIRYFGGIKLGAGGLIRAYRKAVNDCLENANFSTLENGYYIELETNYDKQKDLEYILKDNYKKEYNEKVLYKIECTKDVKEILEKNYQFNLIREKVIEI